MSSGRFSSVFSYPSAVSHVWRVRAGFALGRAAEGGEANQPRRSTLSESRAAARAPGASSSLGDSAERPRHYRDRARSAPTGSSDRLTACRLRRSEPGRLTEEKARAARQSRWMPSRAVLASVAVCVAAAVSVTWWWWARREPASPALETPRQLTRLTFDPGLQTDPTFSPDGQFIASASNESGNFDVSTLPVAGGPAVQLTSDTPNDTQPDSSPNGARSHRSNRKAAASSSCLHTTGTSSASRARVTSRAGRRRIDARVRAHALRGTLLRRRSRCTSVRGLACPLSRARVSSQGLAPLRRLVFLQRDFSTGVTALEPGASVLPHTSRRRPHRFVALSLMSRAQPLAATPTRSLHFVATQTRQTSGG